MKRNGWAMLVVGIMATLMLWGCAEEKESTPTEDLTAVLKAFQGQNYGRAEALAGKDALGYIKACRKGFIMAFSPDSKEVASELFEAILAKTSGFTFSIIDETVDDGQAVVILEMSNVDLGAFLEGAVKKAMEEALASPNEVGRQQEFERILLEMLQTEWNGVTKMREETFQVTMLWDEGEERWKMTGNNNALLKAIMGYMTVTTISDMQKNPMGGKK